MEIHYLFHAARQALDIKQNDIAAAVGIAQASLSQYENEVATLSQKTLLDIAPRLCINPAYLKGKSKNPFKSSAIIYMQFVSPRLVGPFTSLDMRLFPLFSIIDANDWVEFVTVYPESDNMLRLVYPPPLPRLLVVKDKDNNIFVLMSKKSERLEFMEGDSLRSTLSTWFALEKKIRNMDGFVFKESTISDELYSRLRMKAVARKEMQSILKEASYSKAILPFTEKEEYIFHSIREQTIDPDDIIAFIKRKTKPGTSKNTTSDNTQNPNKI